MQEGRDRELLGLIGGPKKHHATFYNVDANVDAQISKSDLGLHTEA